MHRRWGSAARWLAFSLVATALVVAPFAGAEGTIEGRLRVEVGGPTVADNPEWIHDTKANPSGYVDLGTNVAETPFLVDATDPSLPEGTPASVFETWRWDPWAGGDMRWSFPVDAGRWRVRLYFAENNPRVDRIGERLFDVAIEGDWVLTRFDIYAEAGAHAGVARTFDVTSDGSLDVTFRRINRAPLVSAIELIELDTTTTDPGPEPATDPVPEPDPEPQGSCDGVAVPSGASIQQHIDANPAGATLCLSGTYRVGIPLQPKDGQTFVGPASLVGDGADTGFAVKTGNGRGATGVTIDGLEMSGFTLRAVDCWEGTTVRRSDIHHNGRNGLGCGLEGHGGVLIEDNDVHHNGNTLELGRGGAGMKFAAAGGVTVRGNRVWENVGNGVWCDVDCGAFTVVDNRIWGNTRKGVFYEISHGPALIAGNTVLDNNCSPDYWGDGNPACYLNPGVYGPQSPGSPGGGIATNSSTNVTIRDNVLGGNMEAGINVRDDSRIYDAPFGIRIEGNDMRGDRLLHCGEWGVTCVGNA